MSEGTVDSPTWPCKAFWEDAFSSALIWKINVAFNVSLNESYTSYISLCIHELPYSEYSMSVCVCVCVCVCGGGGGGGELSFF